MKFYIADAFAESAFGGNPAGVALVEEFPPEEFMRKLDAELHFSETAFVRRLGPDRFHIRYFTPAEEVPLCGHATIAAFSCLRDDGVIAPGKYVLQTLSGELNISVNADSVFMDMAPPRLLGKFSPEEQARLYAACGLDLGARPEDLEPAIVSTGLADIMLPVKNGAILNSIRPDFSAMTELSRAHDILSFHVFCPGEGDYLARCRDFAPVCHIPEEAATGTANGALTYYLFLRGLAAPDRAHRILQGEAMGRPSVVQTSISATQQVRVGGGAVMLMKGELSAPRR